MFDNYTNCARAPGDHIDGSVGFCPSSCPGAGSSPAPASCSPGTAFSQDCNTCVCSQAGQPVCTTTGEDSSQ